jgi:hypothetical protein
MVSRNAPFAHKLVGSAAIALQIGVFAAARASSTSFAGPAPAASQPNSNARVLIAKRDDATTALNPNPAAVRELVNLAISRFEKKPDAASAWRALVKSNDVVGVKVFSSPGANSGTRPSVVAAIVEGLLAAGTPSSNIVVWDKRLSDLRNSGFADLGKQYNIRVEGASEQGYDDDASYTNSIMNTLVYGDHEFGKKGEGIGRRSFVSNIVTREVTKIICVSPLLNHNIAGVTGCLASVALGSVDNTMRFEGDLDRLAVSIPEIYAMEQVGDKVVLNIIDALLCQYEGERQSLLHYSTALNEIWISLDPVELDVMCIQELNRQREASGLPAPKSPLEIYKNASALELGDSDPRDAKLELVK